MSYPADQVEELKRLCEKVSSSTEANIPYLELKGLRLTDLLPAKLDALLCPGMLDGYHSRLFLSERPTGGKSSTLNWTAGGRVILARAWHMFSWQLGSADHRLAQLVALHLKAFR